MIFRTPIQVEKQPRQINYRDPILMLGSCFTENIGSHLSNLLFDAVVNPFGVVYNPLSVQKNIFQLLNKERYMEDDLNLHGELWFSFDHYTLYSDPDPKKALEKINADFVRARETLSSARFLIITFGTAYTYRYRKSGEIVCNCHKIPANEFERSLLSPKTIIREYESLLTELGKQFPDLYTIFTVSPVRHLKDGMTGNLQSKATLLLAIRELNAIFPETTGYFPAYEIMMDDLRDYRFYDDDMVHPNKQAISYIWEKFMESAIDKESQEILKEIEKFLKAKHHRPVHRETNSYSKFTEGLKKKEEELKSKFPFIQWKYCH